MITEHDKEHMDEIMAGYGDWFTADLLRLMRKADSKNFAKLAIAFPEEAAAYVIWNERAEGFSR